MTRTFSHPKWWGSLLALLSLGGLLLLQGPIFANKKSKVQPAKVTNPFAGLPPMKAKGNERFFRFRPGPKPPGKIGTQISMPFPPKTRPKTRVAPKIKRYALKVTHARPKGKNQNVGAVSVTFNQPMIALSSVGQSKKAAIPMKIKPQPKGRFRWLGTSTVVFEPKGRMPYATSYTVTIPKGTKSATGQRLKRAFTFKFQTPRLTITRQFPSRYRAERPTTWIGLHFNQDINPRHILQKLRISSPRGRVKYRLVPHKKWSQNKRQWPYFRSWNKRRSVILKPVRKLPKATQFRIVLARGTKGEGPLRTKNTYVKFFKTYGPMRLTKSQCTSRKSYLFGLMSSCYPTTRLYYRFSNALGPNDWKKLIKNNRKLKDIKVQAYGQYLYLSRSEGWPPSSSVTITLRKGIKDIYGQTTTRSYTRTFRFIDAAPMLKLPRYGSATIEAKEAQRLTIKMRNIFNFRLQVKRITPAQLHTYTNIVRRLGWYKYRNANPLAGHNPDIDKRIRTRAAKNKRIDWELSLEKLFNNKPGIAIVLLTSNDLKARYNRANPHRGIIIQSTDIGLTMRYSYNTIATLAQSFKRNKVVPRTKLTLFTFNGQHTELWSGRTDGNGYTSIPGPSALKRRGPFLLVASKGNDQAYAILRGRAAAGYTQGYSRYSRVPKQYRSLFYLFTDKTPYKPGETINIRGVLRRQIQRPFGGVTGLGKQAKKVHYTIHSPRYQLLKKGTATLEEGDAFSIKFALKELADLGYYRVRGHVTVDGKRHGFYHSIPVQAYRTPEYKVSVNAQKGPYFLGQKRVRMTVTGRYTFGAPMKGAKVKYTLRRKKSGFRPPAQPPRFSFGVGYYSPYGWRGGYGRRYGRYRRYYNYRRYSGALLKKGKGTLNAQGQLVLPVDLKAPKSKHPAPMSYVLEAQVFDKNRQAIAGRRAVLAHPSSLYIGIRTKRSVLKAKTKGIIQVLAVGIDGKRIPGVDVSIRVLQRKTTRKAVKQHGAWGFIYKSKEVKVTSCKVQSSKDIAQCAIRVKTGGYYILEARAKDSKGRVAITRKGVYAYGKSFVRWKTNNPERLELIPDRKNYKPGQVAKILVKSPFRKAHGILTIERNGIAEHRRITLTGSAQAVKVKIRREYLPNLWVSVSLSRGRIPLSALGLKANAKGAEDLGRPAYAFGTKRLGVSLTEKQLRVAVTPSADTIRPGSDLVVKLKATDYKGKAVRGLITLALVDEGVLSLLGYQTPAPLKRFHQSRPAWSVMQDMRLSLLRRKKKHLRKRGPTPRKVMIKRKYKLLKKESRRDQAADAEVGANKRQRLSRTLSFSSAPASGRLAGGAPGSRRPAPAPVVAQQKAASVGTGSTRPIRVRSKFAATAFYRAVVRTDSNGNASVKIKMPDNLTTFRIMAVALDGNELDRFGHGENRVVIRKPLLLRPALPRFANLGDKFEAAVVINNETNQSGKVDVLIRGVNVVFTGQTKKSITIPAGEAREVRFPVKVTHSGTARFQFAAVFGRESDAVEKAIPVLVPATAEAFATYGTTMGSVAQPIQAPPNALPQFGGLKISLSSSALTGLEDAVRYLVDYPYGCNEQIASRAMPVFALDKILPEFKIGKVSDIKKMRNFGERAIAKLLKRQAYNGGWDYWGSSNRYQYMWVSGYVTYALLRAQKAGYTVSKYKLNRALQFLRGRLRYSPYLWERKSATLRTMAVWVLSEKQKGLDSYINNLYGRLKELPLFAKAWLMVAIYRHNPKDKRVANLLRILDNSATQLPGRVHFAEKKTESLRMLMHSNDRSDAIILKAILEVKPKYALIPKIVRGLMRSRIRGRWSTTQANAFAMLALAQYYSIYEKIVPNFTVQNWLGNGYLGKATMKGRSLAVLNQNVPMSFLQKQKKKNLILYKQGKGRLYYRLGVRYAPKDFKLPAEEQGFAVTRSYEPVNKKSDVTRLKDGRWQFTAGAYVRVKLRIVVPGYRYFAAVIDPLPAGLEAVNLQFRTSASSSLGHHQSRSFSQSYSWYSFNAFRHKEKRDSMVILFADRLPTGVYHYTYLARATTIGEFIVPPARAEEMYSPEVFGRSPSMFADVVAK